MSVESILGRKVGMTQIFTEEGQVIPVTVIEAGPCVVVSKRNIARDGYNAVSLGFDQLREKHVSKPYAGQFTENVKPTRHIKEVKIDDIESYNIGDEIKASIFTVGDTVDVVGTSKGKGMQGVVKLHGMKGGKATHGSNHHRRAGATGNSADPARVFPGHPMPARMGGKRVTVTNLNVVQVDEEKNILLIKGAIPGRHGSLVTIIKKSSGKGE